MIASLLITFREVIEASLIVATVLGILVRLGHRDKIRTVWHATGAATLVSVVLLGVGSLLGIKVQQVYSGRIEEVVEGVLMVVSAFFITWAVFFLHKYFAHYKVRLLQKVKTVVERRQQRGLFALVFTAVFREGFEIVLFLSSIYFSENPASILSGFAIGAAAGLAVSFAFFTSTLKLPVYYAFRFSSILLMLFAAGLLARGVHEFMEAGIWTYPTSFPHLTIPFLPAAGTFAADIIKAMFGVRKTMDLVQLTVYLGYVWLMHWRVFVRNSSRTTS